jgi:hypothetical protein
MTIGSTVASNRLNENRLGSGAGPRSGDGRYFSARALAQYAEQQPGCSHGESSPVVARLDGLKPTDQSELAISTSGRPSPNGLTVLAPRAVIS